MSDPADTPPDAPETTGAPSPLDAALLRVGRFADRTRLLTVGGWGLFAASTVLGAALAVPTEPPAAVAKSDDPEPVRTAELPPREWPAVPEAFDPPPARVAAPIEVPPPAAGLAWDPPAPPSFPPPSQVPAGDDGDPWADLPPAARDDLAAIRDRFGSVADRLPVAPPALPSLDAPPAPLPTPLAAVPVSRPRRPGSHHGGGPLNLDGLRHAARTLRHNLANALTPGYRRRDPVCGETAGPAGGAGVAACGVRVDVAAGPVRETGRPLDAAVDGPGWFRLSGGAGDAGGVALTRAGLFGVTGGKLVFAPDPARTVLGTDGEAISVSPEAAAVRIAADGTVFVTVDGAESPAGRLAVVAPADPAAVAPAGGLVYAAAAVRPVADAAVRPGYLEGSNVTVDAELARLAEVDRLLGVLETAAPRVAGRD